MLGPNCRHVIECDYWFWLNFCLGHDLVVIGYLVMCSLISPQGVSTSYTAAAGSEQGAQAQGVQLVS